MDLVKKGLFWLLAPVNTVYHDGQDTVAGTVLSVAARASHITSAAHIMADQEARRM